MNKLLTILKDNENRKFPLNYKYVRETTGPINKAVCTKNKNGMRVRSFRLNKSKSLL